VRFGKRKNTLAALGRRLFGKQQEQAAGSPARNEGVVREERDALLDSGPYEDSQSPYTQDLEPSPGFSFSMDPIQKLWVKLGHFSRQLSRAQTGAGASGWDDQAMADLAEALEIALNNDMQMICIPLIDVGRVLASYRAVGKPIQCLPFLFEAYDQLSMIAGDVVVGTVSEAVQRRWEELYDAQVRRMREEGIPLVEDDEDTEDEDENQRPASATTEVSDSTVVKTETEDITAVSIAASGSFDTTDQTAAAFSETRAEQEFFEEVDQAMEQMKDTDEDATEHLPPPPPDESILSTSGWQSVISEIAQPTGEKDLPKPTELPVPPEFPRSDDRATALSAARAQAQVPDQSEETVFQPDISAPIAADIPDTIEREAAPESQDQAAQSAKPVQSTAADNLISFPAAWDNSSASEETESAAAWADTAGAEESATPTSPDSEVDAAQTDETAAHEPDVDAEENQTMVTAETPVSVQTADTLPLTAPEISAASSTSESLSGESVETDTPVQQEEDPVEALNRAMQKAILAGKIADARVLAIKLAAALARREVEHAEQTIAETALELENNRIRIEEAHRREQEAEERVARVEAQIAERQEDQADNRQRLMEIDSDIQSRQARIEELEAQIRRLQELRANELDKLRDKELERESVLARDSLLDAELSALDAEEEAARDFLTDARDRLAHLRTEREKLEARLAEWQQERDRRARHVEEIEAPLYPKTPPRDSGEQSAPAGQNDQPMLC